MEVFPFSPVGDVKITYDWGSKETGFADGSKQYVRKRVHAKKSYAFSIGGAEDYAASMKRLLAFFDAHRGIEDTFLFRYDKHTEVVRFGAAIVPKCYRENGRIVTFTCAITLDVAQAADEYGTAGADDTLPVPLGETEETFDWQTGTVTLGVKSDYYQKRTKPARKIAAHFAGLHAQRDELLRLFLAHSRTPVIYKNHGETLRVIFPDKIELTDHLEAGNVIGFETHIELEVVA